MPEAQYSPGRENFNTTGDPECEFTAERAALCAAVSGELNGF
jgi:hypothetical protein